MGLQFGRLAVGVGPPCPHLVKQVLAPSDDLEPQAVHGGLGLRQLASSFPFDPAEIGAHHHEPGKVDAGRFGQFDQVREHGPYGGIPGEHGWIPIVLRARSEELLPTEPEQRWLAYGDWRFWAGSSGYREIQLWIRGPWQITTW
ncbi:hypothetical protein AB0I53_18695 [Saccharopolyspora sp. NPDC050389]|uniref:hypothetical protein n=1 Tax=Saccharopolyspora sp. NPDC050389 TaxID=3155516 RepID=UPI0033CCB056